MFPGQWGQWGQTRTLCMGISVTHRHTWRWLYGQHRTVFHSSGELLQIIGTVGVMASSLLSLPWFFSTKHSLMFSTENSYDRHISAINHFTCACPCLRPCCHAVLEELKDSLLHHLLHECCTPFTPEKTAAALAPWCDLGSPMQIWGQPSHTHTKKKITST